MKMPSYVVTAIASLCLLAPFTYAAPAMTVISLTKLSETRITRTDYDYVFKITVQNGG